MPSQQQIRDVNAGLRSSLAEAIELAKVVHTEEGMAQLQKSLDRHADGIGTFINLQLILVLNENCYRTHQFLWM